MIECIPSEEICPGVSELETALWIETGEKVMQYVDKNYKREKKASSADDDETRDAESPAHGSGENLLPEDRGVVIMGYNCF